MNDYPTHQDEIAERHAHDAHYQAMMAASARQVRQAVPDRTAYYVSENVLCGHRATADVQRAADEAAGGLVALACGGEQPSRTPRLATETEVLCPHCDWARSECHCEPEPTLRTPCEICRIREATRQWQGLVETHDICRQCDDDISETYADSQAD